MTLIHKIIDFGIAIIYKFLADTVKRVDRWFLQWNWTNAIQLIVDIIYTFLGTYMESNIYTDI